MSITMTAQRTWLMAPPQWWLLILLVLPISLLSKSAQAQPTPCTGGAGNDYGNMVCTIPLCDIANDPSLGCEAPKTCAELGGVCCNTSQTCLGGTTENASDCPNRCCVGGSCEPSADAGPQEADAEIQDGADASTQGADAGDYGNGNQPPDGCSCQSASSEASAIAMLLIGLLLLLRRRRRSVHTKAAGPGVCTLLVLLAATMGAASGARAAELPPAFSGRVNPCPEGRFLDIGENQCKELDRPDLGFDIDWFVDEFPSDFSVTITAADCTQNALEAAIAQVDANGGGTINIEACTLEITSTVSLTSRLILQGRGSDMTTIAAAPGMRAIAMLRHNDGTLRHLVIRDMTISGWRSEYFSDNGEKLMGILTSGKNILVERVTVTNLNWAAIKAADHSQHATLRYIHGHDIGNHVIGIKNCWPSAGPGIPGSYTEESCTGGDPDFLTYDVAIYSVRAASLPDQQGIPLDLHSALMEVAGCELLSSRWAATKLPEKARQVWIHDNYVHGASRQGIYPKSQYCETLAAGMQSGDFFVYRNRIEDVGGIGFRTGYVTNVWLKDNIVRNNGQDGWYTGGSCNNEGRGTALEMDTAFLCPGGDLTSANHSGPGAVTEVPANDPRCDLANAATIFN